MPEIAFPQFGEDVEAVTSTMTARRATELTREYVELAAKAIKALDVEGGSLPAIRIVLPVIIEDMEDGAPMAHRRGIDVLLAGIKFLPKNGVALVSVESFAATSVNGQPAITSFLTVIDMDWYDTYRQSFGQEAAAVWTQAQQQAMESALGENPTEQ